MKTMLATGLFIVTLFAAVAQAEPERITVKPSARKAKEKLAAEQIKQIDLKNIQDPHARKAIGEILNYLNLQSKE